MPVNVEVRDGLAEVRLERGKVNALNEAVVDELARRFGEMAADSSVRGSILTGTGKFFSFGFDIPEFMNATKAEFTSYLGRFAALYRDLFMHPKPIVAALNGHTVAGGCMLATACDARIMVSENAKIGLNEIGFGSSLFAGSLAILKFWVGERRAQDIAYGGALHAPGEALALGLVDATVAPDELAGAARSRLAELAAKPPAAFASIKRLLRRPVLDEIERTEADSIREFVDIWYSPEMRLALEKIKIRG